MTIGDGSGGVRVAAVGDLHVIVGMRGLLRAHFARLTAEADLLLLAGDLTDGGLLSQAHTLADELATVRVPMVAVLGNHDCDDDNEARISVLLREAGVRVLDGTGTVLEVRGTRVGVAGTIGFDGGFGADADLGEGAEHKRAEAARLAKALSELAGQRADIRIALTHFSPVLDTLSGEEPEVVRYLGSEELGRAIDTAGADLAVHGHAHHGVETGSTPNGIPVRNVARFVLRRSYAVYRVAPAG